MLRLPREMSTEQKKQRVAKVIAALGLNRCKDTIIGLQPRLFWTDTLALVFYCLPAQHVPTVRLFCICKGTFEHMPRYTDSSPDCFSPFKHEPSIRSLIQITRHHLLWQHTVCTCAHAQIQTHMHTRLAAATHVRILSVPLLLNATVGVCLDLARAGCLQL